MELHELKPLFGHDMLKENADEDQLKAFFKIFEKDFITNPLVLNGKKIKIINAKSKIPDLKDYPETFAHIVTRDYKSQAGRFYESDRANRIHWIKPILTSHPCNEILYYKWEDDNGICKEHFWYFAKNFMVVLKTIKPDLQIVTAFCVDDDEKLTYYERYKNYKDGKSNC